MGTQPGKDPPGSKWMRPTGGVKVAVTEIAWNGSLRRRALDTSGLTDPRRWEELLEQVLSVPPPAYRATPGRPVYVVRAGDRAMVVGEENLIGSLQDLVTTILDTGEPPLAARICRVEVYHATSAPWH
jgi:hypothetical protein